MPADFTTPGGQPQFAWMQGDLKLFGCQQPHGNHSWQFFLYNISADRNETRDLWALQRSDARRLFKDFSAWQQDVLRSQVQESQCAGAVPPYAPVPGMQHVKVRCTAAGDNFLGEQNAPSTDRCAAACAGETGCHFFSINDPPQNCWLFRACAQHDSSPTWVYNWSTYEIGDAERMSGRQLSAALYGAPALLTPDHGELPAFYRSLGFTAVWTPYVQGAFAVDVADWAALPTVAEVVASGTLRQYASAGLAVHFFERPVPSWLWVRYQQLRGPTDNTTLWDDTPLADALWAQAASNISRVYPQVRAAGYQGLVYDSEDYYGQGVFWMLAAHAGPNGSYYRRGRQVGTAIAAAWPDVNLTDVYGIPEPGWRWFLRGLQDGGVRLRAGLEHTYGAGPCQPGAPWYTCWWRHNSTWAVAQADLQSLTPAFANATAVAPRVAAGLFPFDLSASPKANYLLEYFAQQLHSALCDGPAGPLPVWLWVPGALNATTWAALPDHQQYQSLLSSYTRGAVACQQSS